jgi:hypothetical protein
MRSSARIFLAYRSKIHTVLTDNGLHFADPLGESWTAAEIKQLIARTHAFEFKADVDHRLTKPKRVC